MGEPGEVGPKFGGRRVLVTGVAGFLGRAVAAHLVSLGAEVVSTSRRGGGRLGALAADLQDERGVAALAEAGPFEAIAHCAAILPGEQEGMDLLTANLRMTHNLARLAVEREASSFLFASSCAVYGIAGGARSEGDLPAPASLYALSKLSGELMLRAVLSGTGVRVASLRIPAPYGPSMNRDTVLVKFLRAAAAGEPVRLLGSGARTQNFVFEDDVARAFALAWNRAANGVFNVPGGPPVSMRALAEAAGEAVGRKPPLIAEGVDPQEHFRASYSGKAAEEAFGYLPVTPLLAGLRATATGLGITAA